MKLVIAALIGITSTAAHAVTPRIILDELRALQLNKAAIELVDVRMPADFAKGHIQGARNVPQGEIGTGVWDREKHVVVYCTEDPCPMSDRAAERLAGLGYAKVSILAEGFAAWAQKGYPVVVEKESDKPRPGRLAVEAVKARIEKGDLTVLDVRPAAEFAAGHLKGALNSPLEGMTALLPSISKDKDVLVYDRTAPRARQAAVLLLEAGCKVYEMPGGLIGWTKKKYPLEMK